MSEFAADKEPASQSASMNREEALVADAAARLDAVSLDSVASVTLGHEEEDSQFKDADEGYDIVVNDDIAEEEDDNAYRSIEEATAAKEEGNKFFRDKDFATASQYYSRAVELCPRGDEHKEALSTFYGNRAACFQFLGDMAECIEDCTAALALQPSYVKVLMRRAQAYESLGKLDEALGDVNRIVELDASYPKAKEMKTRLAELVDERNKKMTAEALDKLKSLGNSILGNFGLSLDNFKMQQDPATGSWSVSMNK